MLMITDAFLLILSIPMFTTTHKRQSSLKNLRSVKSTLAFSPQRLLPSITEHREVKKVNGVYQIMNIERANPSNLQVQRHEQKIINAIHRLTSQKRNHRSQNLWACGKQFSGFILAGLWSCQEILLGAWRWRNPWNPKKVSNKTRNLLPASNPDDGWRTRSHHERQKWYN